MICHRCIRLDVSSLQSAHIGLGIGDARVIQLLQEEHEEEELPLLHNVDTSKK